MSFLGSSNRSLTSFPWKFIFVLWFVLVAVTLSVPIVDWARTPAGAEYTGYSYESVGDIFVYLNYLDQAKQGVTGLSVMMTPEIRQPGLFHPLFLFMGRLSRWIGLPEIVSWHFTRTLFILPFLILLVSFLRRCFSSPRMIFAVTLAVCTTGSLMLQNHESSVFLGMLFTPLSVFTCAMSIGFFFLFLVALEQGWTIVRAGILIVLASLQAMVQPYILIVWFVVPMALLFLDGILGVRPRIQTLRLALPFLPAALASYGYLGYLLLAKPLLHDIWTGGAVIVSWHWAHVIFFIGILGPFAVIGVSICSKVMKTHTARLLVVWFVAAFVLSRSPYWYAGRLMLLVFLPLAIFAAVGAVWLWEKHRTRTAVSIALVFVFTPAFSDNIRHLYMNYKGTYYSADQRYISRATYRGTQWMRNHLPSTSVILHAPIWDTVIARYSYRHVYTTFIGTSTTDSLRRTMEAWDIYAGHYSAERLFQFLRDQGITHVLLAERDRMNGYFEGTHFGNRVYAEQYAFQFQPEHYPFLEKVYDEEGFSVYAYHEKPA